MLLYLSWKETLVGQNKVQLSWLIHSDRQSWKLNLQTKSHYKQSSTHQYSLIENWQKIVLHPVSELSMLCRLQQKIVLHPVTELSMLCRLPYADLFGGVTALRLEHLSKVNGYSNKFFGWGGEDDDLSARCELYCCGDTAPSFCLCLNEEQYIKRYCCFSVAISSDIEF